MIGLSLAVAAMAGSWARAQDKIAEFVPREEMIDALIHYAAAGGCETRRNVFGAAFDATCRNRGDAGGSDHMTMWLLLDRLPERELIERCRRNRIADCEKPREVSKGRSVLTFESAFGVEFHSYRATWSPDGRLLLLDNLNLPLGEVRLLDVAAARLLDRPLYAGPIHDAAWSPDGRYIALSDRKRAHPEQAPPAGTIRLYAASTRNALGRVSVADTGCSLRLLEGMAFAADSRALWVLCSQADKTARAVRLKVPGLEVEESFAPATPIRGWSETYWEEGIQRFAEDLVVTARFRSPTPVRGPRSAVRSYSLRTREPLYAPVHAAAAVRLAPDLSGLYVGNELWSTHSGQRIATGINPDGRHLGAPNRLPQLGLHIEARPRPKSRRSVLAVADSATGDTVQEIGPVSTVLSILAAPNGSRVAVAGFHSVRFYRVNPGAAAAPARRER